MEPALLFRLVGMLLCIPGMAMLLSDMFAVRDGDMVRGVMALAVMIGLFMLMAAPNWPL